jgi:hypothetical protein
MFEYKIVQGMAGRYKETEGIYFNVNTPEAVCEALVRAYRSEARVRLWYGYTSGVNAGKTWDEEHDVCGRVARTCGEIKIPILLANINSSDGLFILDNHIVRIDIKGKTLYQHPMFELPEMEVEDGKVYFNNEFVARFETEKQAIRYIDFMSGKRFGR